MSLLKMNGYTQIQSQTIGNDHIDTTNPIQETGLSIDWSNHTETLEARKVLTTNQISNVTVAGIGSVDVTTAVGGSSTSVASSSNTLEGVITDTPNNKVLVRDYTTDKGIMDAQGNEVYGRMTSTTSGGATPTNSFTVTFYSMVGGTETSFSFPADQANVLLMYNQRYNLLTAPESFAQNSKFIQDQTDYEVQAQVQSNTTEIVDARTNAKATPVTYASLTARLDAMDNDIATASQNSSTALNQFETDLSSTSAGKGAALVGITASASLNGTDTTVEKSLEDITTEILAGRGSAATIANRLSTSMNTDGSLIHGKQIHDHKRHDIASGITQGQTNFDLYALTGDYFQLDGTLEVYVNGGLQMGGGVNYNEVAKSGSSTQGQTVSFTAGLNSTDKVTFRYVLNNAQ